MVGGTGFDVNRLFNYFAECEAQLQHLNVEELPDWGIEP